MDIGNDLFFAGADSVCYAAAREFLKRRWPEAVEETVDDDQGMLDPESFFCEDQAAWDAIEEQGIAGDLQDKLIHLILNGQGLTVVYGDGNKEMVNDLAAVILWLQGVKERLNHATAADYVIPLKVELPEG